MLESNSNSYLKHPRSPKIYTGTKDHRVSVTRGINIPRTKRYSLAIAIAFLEIVVTNVVNPASFLQETPTKPLVHDCLATIGTIYSSRPDLKEEPLEGADSWYTDGSSFVKDGKRRTGYAITTTSKVIDPLTPQHRRQK